jgi:hypothetical protein
MKTAVVAVASLLLLARPGRADVPAAGPRAFITNENRERFRDYCLHGAGSNQFHLLRQDFDKKIADRKFPSEPENFGDPDPATRDSDKADQWREAQAACNFGAGAAEAATIFWIVTGETSYLNKAKEFLMAACRWDPGGTTGVRYNDEANFRLWRKLPFVYDQLRTQLNASERTTVLASFQKRGTDTFATVRSETKEVRPNSIESETASHGVRFVSMMGIAGLALYDDLPEAKEWFSYALNFYANQFTPWGGVEGGWGEGSAYWRGNIEHARFQDALHLIRHPEAWKNPFWRKTGYFPLYFVQPYATTQFGDTPSAGKLRLEPQMANLLLRLARQFKDGYLLSYASLLNPSELVHQSLNISRANYPTAMEYLLENFSGSSERLPTPLPLSALPQSQWFKDVGWVSMHSALGRPGEDIMLSFKSSSYGSYSHSHADQNGFILNAFGENLAINSGYREFHRSAHHKGYTRQTISKNAILIDDHGQLAQSEAARGEITRFGSNRRLVWTTGDALQAYTAEKDGPPVSRVTRDVVFVDKRYFVIRDVVRLRKPASISWLIHAEHKIEWDPGPERISILGTKANLRVQLVVPENSMRGMISSEFPVPVEPKYISQGYANQRHFKATTEHKTTEQVLYSVLWPEKVGQPNRFAFTVHLQRDGSLAVQRPDGGRDRLWIEDARMEIK